MITDEPIFICHREDGVGVKTTNVAYEGKAAIFNGAKYGRGAIKAASAHTRHLART